MDHPLLQSEVNRDIICLLIVSKLSPLEKRVWLNTLVYMTDAEKNELRDNLKQEVKYEVKVEEDAIDQFMESLGKVNN